MATYLLTITRVPDGTFEAELCAEQGGLPERMQGDGFADTAVEAAQEAVANGVSDDDVEEE